MPLDFASIIKAGQSLVPDIRAEMMQEDERRAINEQRQALAEQRRAATDAAQQKQARQQQLQTSLNEAVLSGNPRAISRLMLQFPEYADQMKPGWEALHGDERRTNQTMLGSAYVRAQNKDFKGAAAILQRRYDADLAAESPDPLTKQLIDELNSDDANRQRIAMSTIGIYLAADDPSKFAQIYPDIQREERLQELQPAELAIKQAEAASAPDYYDARAAKEGADAKSAASDAKYRDARNAAQVEHAGATTANLWSLIKRRAASLGKRPDQLTEDDLGGGVPAPKPSKAKPGGRKEVTATDGKGNRIRYNPAAKQWEPL